MAARRAASRLSLARQARDLGPWRLPAMALAAVVLLIAPRLAWASFVASIDGADGADWHQLVLASQRLGYGILYTTSPPFTWSPVAALLMVAVAPVGLATWRIAHLVLLGFTRDWRVVALALLGFPFWLDVERGNLVTLMAVAGVCALRGSRAWTWVCLGLFILVPNPILLPLVGWLLWHRRELRLTFAALFLAHASTLGLLGLLEPWLTAMLGAAAAGVADPLNLSPSRWIGAWWTPVGTALGLFLAWRGHLGWAGLAISPYLLPYHAMVLLFEFVRPLDQRRTQITATVSA